MINVPHPNELTVQRFEELRLGAIVNLDPIGIEMSRYVYSAATTLDCLKREKESAEAAAQQFRLGVEHTLTVLKSLKKKPTLKDYRALLAIVQENLEALTVENEREASG